MILTRQIHAIRDCRGLLRGAQTRLQGVWRDPVSTHVVTEYWVPLSMNFEELEARLIQCDSSISRDLAALRDLT
jgi:hypothetical protein